MQESVPVGPARPDRSIRRPARVDGDAAGPLADPRALQILSTEHWSLLAGRSLAYNEAFSRAGHVPHVPVGVAHRHRVRHRQPRACRPTVVAGRAVILLLADLFIGLATVGRLDRRRTARSSSASAGMNRIRHAYRRDGARSRAVLRERAFHDDARGVLADLRRRHDQRVSPRQRPPRPDRRRSGWSRPSTR